MFKDTIETGGVAVVTGGASGVGLAAAKAFARQGLSVVLVDTNADALEDAARAVEAHTQGSAKVITAKTDVSDAASMAHLAQTAQDLGPVAVLMNNAGIAVPTESWGKPENWRRLIDVNLFGVVNGVHAFVPLMIEANRPAAIINTGSKQGITTPPGNPGYNVSKAGVKVLTEMLAHDLRAADAPISAHLFVPGFTYTGMIASFLPDKPPAAWTSEQAVSYLFERLERDDFYILCPDNEVSEEIDQRRVAWAAQDVVENSPALSRWHPDYADAFKRFEGG